jgi:hypothetical protein
MAAMMTAPIIWTAHEQRWRAGKIPVDSCPLIIQLPRPVEDLEQCPAARVRLRDVQVDLWGAAVPQHPPWLIPDRRLLATPRFASLPVSHFVTVCTRLREFLSHVRKPFPALPRAR